MYLHSILFRLQSSIYAFFHCIVLFRNLTQVLQNVPKGNYVCQKEICFCEQNLET